MQPTTTKVLGNGMELRPRSNNRFASESMSVPAQQKCKIVDEPVVPKLHAYAWLYIADKLSLADVAV